MPKEDRSEVDPGGHKGEIKVLRAGLKLHKVMQPIRHPYHGQSTDE